MIWSALHRLWDMAEDQVQVPAACPLAHRDVAAAHGLESPGAGELDAQDLSVLERGGPAKVASTPDTASPATFPCSWEATQVP